MCAQVKRSYAISTFKHQIIAMYERGGALKTRCDALLKSAELRVEKVRLTADGEPAGTQALDSADDIPF